MVRERSISSAGRSGPEPHLVAAPESLGRLLALTSKAVREWFESHLAAHGGSLPMWIVLTHAIESDESPSQRELAARMCIGGATLVRHLDRLEGEGLVVRRRDEQDRRVTRVDITPAGRQRHQELAVVANEVDREVQGLMSDEEERTLRSVLNRLGDHALRAPRPTIPMHPAERSELPERPHLSTDETDVA
jgi:MarR family transcriptional regulator, transcriptional regulator for hemolysin